MPSALRKKQGILPGEKVTVTEIDGRLQISSLFKDPVTSLLGCFKNDKKTKELIA